jgi:hypothetical protein
MRSALRGRENVAVFGLRQHPDGLLALIFDHPGDQSSLLAWLVEAVGHYQGVAFLVHKRKE